MDTETVTLIFTIIVVGIALAAQRRADMKLMNTRFDDVSRRFDDVNRRFDDFNRRFDDMHTHFDKRFDDMHTHFDKRFDDMHTHFDKRIGAVERQQRVDSATLAAVSKEVAKLAGRVDELAALVSSAFQAVIGVVVARGDRKDRGSSVARQAPFRESGPKED